MKNIVVILFILLASFISPQNTRSGQINMNIINLKTIDESYFVSKVDHGDTIKILFDKNDALLLFVFSSDTQQRVLFDLLAFCMTCVGFKGNDDVLSFYSSNQKPTSLEEFLNFITRTQILVENEDKQLKLFAHFNMPMGKGVPRYDIRQGHYFCYGENILFKDDEEIDCEEVYLIENDVPKTRAVQVLKHHLRIKDNDNKVRLHYLFKPTQRQKELGFDKEFILTSNWFYLDKTIQDE